MSATANIKSSPKFDDSDEEFELTFDDKSLIMDIMSIEHFVRQDDHREDEEYRCVFSCDICHGTSTSTSSPVYNDDVSDLILTPEKRTNIIKELMHNFFKEAWMKKVAERKKVNVKKKTKLKYLHEDAIKKETQPGTILNTNSEVVTKLKRPLSPAFVICNEKHIKTEKEYFSEMKEPKIALNTKQECTDYSIKLEPMDDKQSPFFIDREWVNVELYQDGLLNSDWNPTQVMYEICSQCSWGTPEFSTRSFVLGNGFLFSVRVKDHISISKRWGQTKKIAKHFASSQFLNFIGFKFTYKPT
uniref:DRBM domain-containing protein n=1 Tax=Cuerna arida TaxID=1464854 RepID=A0A1B6FE46_9HEMI